MATAIGYVERKAEDNINWAEVGKNFSNMLNEEMRVREEKKAAIDQSTQDYQKVLNNVPQGENTDLNGFALGFADDLQKQMLMQETLLKSGQLDPRQYNIMRQNLVDGTDQGFGLLQDYNDEYSKKMELNQAGELSAVDLEIMANVEGFANFNEGKLVINPQTGIVSMAKMIKDPNNPDGALIPDPDPNNLVSVQNLKNRIKTTITKFDVEGAAQAWTDTLGEEVIQTVETMGTTYSAGIMKKVTDITSREGGIKDMSPQEVATLAAELGVQPNELKAYSLYQEAQNNWADGQVSDEDFSGASILMDFASFTPDGKQYKTTFNPADVYKNGKDGDRIPGTENIILLKTENGRTKTDLSEEQRNVAKRVLKSQTGVQVDKKVEVQTEFMKKEPRAKTKTELDKKDSDDALDAKVSKIGDLWGGNNASVKGATDYFRDQNESITDVTRDSEGVTVTYINDDGVEESRSISFYVTEPNPEFDETKPIGPNNREERRAKVQATQADVDAGRATAVGQMIDQRKSQEEFIESAGPLLTGEDDISKALERGGYDKDAKFNDKSTSTSKVDKEEAPLDYTTERDVWLDETLETNGITLDFQDDVKVAEQLETTFERYNLKAVPVGAASNKVRITVPGSDFDAVTISTNNYTSTGAEEELDKLKKLIKLITKNDLPNLAKENNWEGEKVDKYGNKIK
jgi:hypothetical protein